MFIDVAKLSFELMFVLSLLFHTWFGQTLKQKLHAFLIKSHATLFKKLIRYHQVVCHYTC